jgi:hypothetical protein
MGLAEVFGQAILKFKADTSQAREEVRKLAGVEKEAAKQVVAAVEEQNAAKERLAAGFEKVNAVMRVATEVVNFASGAWKEYEKAANAAGGVQAQRAAEFRTALKEWDEGMRQVKIAVGELVVALAPLIEAAGELLQLAAKAVSAAAGALAFDPGGRLDADGKISDRERRLRESGLYSLGTVGREQYNAGGSAALAAFKKANDIAAGGLFDAASITIKKAKAKKVYRKSGNKVDLEGFILVEEGDDGTGINWAPDLSAGRSFDGGLGAGVGGLNALSLSNDILARRDSGMPDFAGALSGLAEAKAQLQGAGQASVLESIFGPIDEFNAYSDAFAGLTDAVQASFNAWMTGSESIGAAFKRTLIAVAMAEANGMLIQAIKHGAWALGSLAFGDLKGAGTHGIAAAKFAAGAAAIGALAKVASTSMSTPTVGGGGGGAPSVLRATDRPSESRQVVILTGDYLAADNPRRRNADLARAVRSAQREIDGSRSSGVERR